MTLTAAILTALRYADEHPRLDPDTAIETSLARSGWAMRQTAGRMEWPHMVAINVPVQFSDDRPMWVGGSAR